jgi:hypothetical protein
MRSQSLNGQWEVRHEALGVIGSDGLKLVNERNVYMFTHPSRSTAQNQTEVVPPDAGGPADNRQCEVAFDLRADRQAEIVVEARA